MGTVTVGISGTEGIDAAFTVDAITGEGLAVLATALGMVIDGDAGAVAMLVDKSEVLVDKSVANDDTGCLAAA